MTTGSVRLHRVLRCAPEHVYGAFLDAGAMAKWLPPYGFVCQVQQMEAKVGGRFQMSFRNFKTGQTHSFGGEYLELIANEKIRYTDKFDDPNLAGEIQVTVLLKKVVCGTEVSIVQEGVPALIPVEMCYLGWQEFVGLWVFVYISMRLTGSNWLFSSPGYPLGLHTILQLPNQ